MKVIVENLTKRIGQQTMLDSLSFEAKRGEVLGFLGLDGAGKTTLLRVISGFLRPDSGNVFVGKNSILKNNRHIRKNIGYLPESNPLYYDMNVIDFLNFVAKLNKVPKYMIPTRIMDMLRFCGLEQEKHKNIKELSKGYRQRVGIAQALIHDPSIVLLDEPTTGLDPNQTNEIRQMIRAIGKEKTVILCSHLLSEIESTCDKVVILNRGVAVASGTTMELKRGSGNNRVLEFMVSSVDPILVEEKLKEVDGVVKIKFLKDFFELTVRRNINIEKSLFEMCKTEGWYFKQLNEVKTTLEDIFLQLTQGL